jgi:DNA primase
MLQQIILEISSHPSMTFFFISFLQSLLLNFSCNQNDEYTDWNFLILNNISNHFSDNILNESEVSLSERLNEISRKKFKKGRVKAKYWLRLFHIHKTAPEKLSKALMQGNDISEFIDKYFAEQISDQIENRVLQQLSESTETKQLMQLQNPFSNFKNIAKKSTKNASTPTPPDPILQTQDMLINISNFLIFLNKTLFLLSENDDLQTCFKINSSFIHIKPSEHETKWNFEISKIKSLKRTFEEEMQTYLDSCDIGVLNMFLDKLEAFLDVHKQVDRDYLKRVLQMLLFTKFEFMKGEVN